MQLNIYAEVVSFFFMTFGYVEILNIVSWLSSFLNNSKLVCFFRVRVAHVDLVKSDINMLNRFTSFLFFVRRFTNLFVVGH